ncbi:MAG: hypothetical protein CMH62_01180 [Nanoarchaeota archaeon]|nr:hypothetical protein [Nanoarchaeota archaeon]
MNVSAADFITTLDNTENFNTSNTKKDSFGFFKPLTDILNEYLPTCPLQGNDCILPIRISSNNNQSLTISNLNYKETTEIGEILIQHNFLSYVEQQGAASQIILNSQTSIPLASFDFKTPQQINTHDLTATIKSETDTEEYTVVIGPKAKINVTSNSADILELIKFDGSDSTAPNNSELSYLWDFDDTSTSTLINPLHSYTKAGTYVVSLTVTDDNNISSTTLKAMTIGALRAQNQATLDEALSLLDEAQQYSTTATPKIKEVYAALDLNEEIKTAKATLVRLSESQADIQPQINSILSSIPKTLSVSNSFEVTPFLRTEDIDALLPLQQESFKDTARTVNEKISQKIKTYLVSTTYLSGQREDFILVRKTINVPQSIPNAVVVDLLPTTILPTQSSISFVKPSTAQVTKFDSSQSVRFSLSNLDVATTNEIVYKLSTTNIGEISKLKTIVLPEDLNVALVPINCGDNICNPGEDILICPEDCTCGNNICEIDETESSCPADCGSKSLVFYVSLLVILGVIVAAGVVVYKNPKLRQQLKINELISKIKSRKKPFSSPSELDKVVDFIKSSKKEGHVDKQISLTLTKKGWTKKQVKHALKKAKKE